MSVKGWNFKLLIAVGHGSKRGRRVRLPSSAPCEPFEVNNFKGFFFSFPPDALPASLVSSVLHFWFFL